LRDKEDVMNLRQYLKKGKIDWIETDHAPHSMGEKLALPYLSGYPFIISLQKFCK